VLLGATVASAHVHVDGEDATRGGYGVLTFRVSTESATASTTEVTVTLPADHPIASVSVQPVAGWTATVTSARLAKPIITDDGQVVTYASRIDWKADAAAAIKPGEFQRFSVSAGPLPDVASIALPTTQRSSDGTTVRWNELATGSAEPEHPAPVLTLAAAEGVAAPTGATDVRATSGTATAALAVAITAVAAALAALVVAVIGLLRGSRRGPA
jgi:uncharacterized protein YcnI